MFLSKQKKKKREKKNLFETFLNSFGNNRTCRLKRIEIYDSSHFRRFAAKCISTPTICITLIVDRSTDPINKCSIPRKSRKHISTTRFAKNNIAKVGGTVGNALELARFLKSNLRLSELSKALVAARTSGNEATRSFISAFASLISSVG